MKTFKESLRVLVEKIGTPLTSVVRHELNDIKKIVIDNYIQENLFNNPKYADPKKLSKYQYQAYSQNMEDGIIQEIFQRIGVTNRCFVEFGVQSGLECNSLFLLLQGWEGRWMDGDKKHIKNIQEKFDFLIQDKKLVVKQAFITAENIEELLNSLSIPKELDLLSIDIDGNDYWVWKAVTNYAPRAVIIEYNAMFRPPVECVVAYEASRIWNGTSHFGASLKSLELLGAKKGYRLVGCDFVGVNAFFVREDLVGDKFFTPYTAEAHYEPPKYSLLNKIGFPRDFGRFEQRALPDF